MKSLGDIRKVHCIGIGGIGVSAIARMMLNEGKVVSGSDRNESILLETLKKEGIEVYIGHKKENIQEDVDLVVYTGAVTDDNEELVSAKEKNIPTLLYSEMLGLISKDKRTIAISGTHGKTTTTAMIAKILIDAGLSPTVIVGSLLKEYNSNYIKGESDIFIVEACEYLKSFLALSPHILVITNIDEDHLDYYKDLDEIKETFLELTGKLKDKDHLVIHDEGENLEEIALQKNSILHEVSDFEIEVGVSGNHNRENARLAYEVGRILGCEDTEIRESLKSFQGTWRRFEFKGENKNKSIIYDDYAHHPKEIESTIKAARESFKDKKLTIIFQPHLYSRTKRFLNDFASVLKDADEVILLPIYAAREKEDETISSEMLKDLIDNSLLFDDFNMVKDYILENKGEDDVIFTIGAGDVTLISDLLLS